MRRSTLLTLAVAALSAAPASAHGFRRPAEVRYYYYPSPVYAVPTYQPVYVAPPTWVMPPAPVLVPSAPVLPPVPAVAMPMVPLSTVAVPLAAPPSATPEPPPAASTSLRVSGSSYEQYSGTPGSAGVRCSVAFWNLTALPLSLRVEGNDYTMPAGRSLTLDLPRSFTWQVAGRAAQPATIPPSDGTAEILIRR